MFHFCFVNFKYSLLFVFATCSEVVEVEVGGGVEVWWCSREFRSSMTWLWRAARKISEGSSWAGCESEWLWRADSPADGSSGSAEVIITRP